LQQLLVFTNGKHLSLEGRWTAGSNAITLIFTSTEENRQSQYQ
jgi:hypothetical protein